MLDISQLDHEDLDAALRLSTQAGWNQTIDDWKRFLALGPEGCFGGYVEGTLVATTCVATYNSDVSWIGMVLVEEAHRHQGYGTALFDRGLAHALANGEKDIGLDASDLGAPLYRDHGFRSAVAVERWIGALTQSQESEHDVCSVTDVDALAALDGTMLGIDRSTLLARLCAEDGVTALAAGSRSNPVGYAIVRPGRIHPQVGPVLAPDVATASSLLNGVASMLPVTTVIVDAIATERTATLLRTHGLERQRELSRMSYESTEPLLNDTTVWAIVDFAWG